MQFSKLRLAGFKSFVDPTEIIIAEGLTGIVGPNGCGKSNLLEALSWVMGENRPKAIRGGEMEDVIFAGAITRPARNFAEVCLSIDNSDRRAPANFNDHDHLEIIRRITRDIGSAYKINGKDTRARDIQMLFADASTGAHSPALVRQGQISTLINAKPKARRRILEEAAGISGLYQRRHEAELKLKNAEINLSRVDDIIEQLNQQLRALEKQAQQTARYREIGSQLRNSERFLVYRRWREADKAYQNAQEELTLISTQESHAQKKVNKATQDLETQEAKIQPLREAQAITTAVLQRLQIQHDTLINQENHAKEQITVLNTRVEQLERDIAREEDLNKDANETIARLTWEKDQLEKASHNYEHNLKQATIEADDAANLLHNNERSLDTLTEDVARLAARHQSTNRHLQEAQTQLERHKKDSIAAIDAVAQAQAHLLDAQEHINKTKLDNQAQQQALAQAEAALQKIEDQRAAIQIDESNARVAFSQADGEANTLKAEISALERVMKHDAPNEKQLLLDQIRVKKGYEAAFGAAFADDLKTPVITDAQHTGWIELSNYTTEQTLPHNLPSLSAFVTAPSVLNRRLSQIALIDPQDAPTLQPMLLPGQQLVSKEGDLWRWDGYHRTAHDTPSVTTLRLQQINRLNELQDLYKEVIIKRDKASIHFKNINTELQNIIKADQDARDRRKTTDQQATTTARMLSKAQADYEMLVGKRANLTLTKEHYEKELLAAETIYSQAKSEQENLGDLEKARGNLETSKIAVEAMRITMLTKRSLLDSLHREGNERIKRQAKIIQELTSWTERLSSAKERVSELNNILEKTTRKLKAAHEEPNIILAKRTELNLAIKKEDKKKNDTTDTLLKAEETLRAVQKHQRESEHAASNIREQRARLGAIKDAAHLHLETITKQIHEDLNTTPAQLLDGLNSDPDKIPDTQRIEIDIARLRRQRDSLGAVNLRAEEDAKIITDERDTLHKEQDDLTKAIKALRTGIANINKEGRERLLMAFEDVNENFRRLFTALFNGGEAKLMLVESDDPLEAGLEIMCQPPGKKLSTLSLLSGGEQTLTALALIFAVFLANPAPVCVLDEVDAPLDDANVTRFCDMLDEMINQTNTRFLIITHHAITMSRMDRLFGVTMAELGVSQLVSVDLQAAEAIIDT